MAKRQHKYLIALDQGFTCTGIVLVEYDEDYIELIDFAYISETKAMKGESECARVFDLAQQIVNIALGMTSTHLGTNDWSLVMEYVYYNRKNPKSLILQSRLLQSIQDIMVLTLREASDFIIYEYNPNTIKKVVCKGQATKTQIREAVYDKVKITNSKLAALETISKPASEAVYDATAVAYTHVATTEGWI